MNPHDPAERSARRRGRSGKAGEFDVESTGDVYQHGNQIAIAHTGQGDIVISIAGERLAVDIPALLSGRIVAPSASIPHTLPRDIPGFTGRSDELAELAGTIGRAAQTGRSVVICAIEGMAGVGKTALAVHAAHQLTSRFPDGQLFLRLHAHTPGTKPVDPGDALAALLREIGVDSGEIPSSLDEKASMWRHRLVDKRVLVLLDDAEDDDQVLPLLPGAGDSVVLVTSRRRLEQFGGDVRVELDLLPVGQAIQLFTHLAGRGDGGSGATAELVMLAGRLPLAIGILAGRLRSRPRWEVSDLVDELNAARDRSAAIGASDQPVSAAFGLSYNPLPEQRRQFFRKLGLNPGTDIDAYAAAAIAGVQLDEASWQLDSLYVDHLIDEPIRGRYQFHDLLSDYARALAITDPVGDQDAAIGRLLDYYLHTVQVGSRYTDRTPPIDLAPGLTVPRHAPVISTRTQAVAWMEAERANLQAITEYSGRGMPRYAVAIPAAMAEFLLMAGHWDQSLTLQNMALIAAHRTGDERGEAVTLKSLGLLQRLKGDYGAAVASLSRARDLYSALGDRLGEANALTNLGPAQDLTGKRVEAAASYTRALELYRALGHKQGEANALTNLAIVQDRTGDHATAIATLSQALELQRAYGDEEGEATTLTNLGAVQSLIGEHAAAAADFGRALELYRALGDRYGQADALNELGIVQDRTGDYAAAAASLTEAHELFTTLGDKSGEAYALTNLGNLQRHKGDYATAKATLTIALELWTSLDDEAGKASTLVGLGDLQRHEGEYTAAEATLTGALQTFRTFGDLHGQSECLNNLGDLLSASSADAPAKTFYEQALALAREATTPLEEARALEGLGRFYLRGGQSDRARTLLHQAFAIYQQLGSPRAQRLEADTPQPETANPPDAESHREETDPQA